MPKKIIIIAGPHGAGKTTFARAFLPEEAGCTRFINIDLIAAGLSPLEPRAALDRAFRLALKEVHTCVRRGESFAFETTLSGRGYRHLIWQWQKAGYRVSLYFLALTSADAAVARVAERMRQGGHGVPEAIIRRQFYAGLHNFEQYYRGSADVWALYDNGWEQPCFLEYGENPTRPVMQRWSETAWRYRLASTHTHAPAWHPRTYTDLTHAPDGDMRGSYAALCRAAEMAQQTAIQTHTAIVVKRKNGKIVRLTASRLQKKLESPAAS